MMGRKPIIVEARRGDERIAGTPAVVGRAIGYSGSYVRRMAVQSRKSSDGWEVVLVFRPAQGRFGRIARIYTAERDGETVTGTALELAAAVGITPEHIRALDRTGKRARNGWTVRSIDRGFDISPDTVVE